jgi:hypothetical protein
LFGIISPSLLLVKGILLLSNEFANYFKIEGLSTLLVLVSSTSSSEV